MKFRTISTSVGIILGIASLTAAFNFTETAKREIMKTVKGFNTDICIIKNDTEPSRDKSSYSPLRCEDMEFLLHHIPSFDTFSPLIIRQASILPYIQETYPVIGCSSSLFNLLKSNISGRTFSEYEDIHQRLVCIIGQNLANKLFGKSNALGLTIRFWGTDFLITGIVFSADKTPYMDPLESVFIPHSLMDRLTALQGFPEMFILRRAKTDESPFPSDSLSGLLSRGKEGRRFEIWDQSEWIAKKQKTVLMIEWLVGSIPMLILLVACISSANMLIVGVTERTKEIGLRIALGASPADILILFLKEGMIMFVWSGILGIILGYYMTLWFIEPLPALIIGYQNWTFSFSFLSVAKTCLILVLSGLVSSLIPALKAARLEPAVALRYE